MTTETILLDNISKIRSFVSDISSCKCKAHIKSHDYKYIIDARSIMGIFSLDVSKPVELILEGDDRDIDIAKDLIKPYVALAA